MRYLQTTDSMNTALLALFLQLSVSSSRPPADSSRDKLRTVPGEVRQCANNEDCRQFVTAEDDLQGESYSILTLILLVSRYNRSSFFCTSANFLLISGQK